MEPENKTASSSPPEPQKVMETVPKTSDQVQKVETSSNIADVVTQAQIQSGSESPTANREGSTRKSVHWSPELVSESHAGNKMNGSDWNSNPYVNHSTTNENESLSVIVKGTMDTVKDMLGRWGKRAVEATKKAEDLAGNTWQHLKTSPSFADAAMGRLAQGTKVLAEGGYEKIFRQSFETVPEEQLQNSFACYLSTSAGPVMGVLYVSTAKLTFCSDNPLSYKSEGQTEWSYYKVVIPLHQLEAVNPSTSRVNPAEKYIQAISVDNHEFWFMGFLSYNDAVGAELYLSNKFTENDMSGLVHWAKYNNAPIALIYGTSGANISSLSSAGRNRSFLGSRLRTIMGVHEDFALSSIKRLNIF